MIPCVKDSNGYTTIFFAAQNGHHNVIELFLTRKEIDINGKDDCGAAYMKTLCSFCLLMTTSNLILRPDHVKHLSIGDLGKGMSK